MKTKDKKLIDFKVYKYVIPNILKSYECQYCSNCIIKQIVEKCKKEIKVYRNTSLPNNGTNAIHFGRQSFAYEILKLLDIQECE